jgi:hypothetical protein
VSGRRLTDPGTNVPLTARAARRRVVRRRRLVAIAAVVGVVAVLATAMVLGHRSRDAFAGTWRGAGSVSLVVAHVNGADYTVVVGSGDKVRAALRSGDRLTIAAVAGTAQSAPAAKTASATSSATSSAAPSATLGASVAAASSSSSRVIVLKPGPGRGTLEECFADGTSTILTRD